jgi:hypothetical protein
MLHHIDRLKEITQFYSGLENELSAALQCAGTSGEMGMADLILQKRSRLAQIGKMSALIFQISEDFRKSSGAMEDGTRREAEQLMARVKSHAVRIHELCALAAEKIEPVKGALQKNLEEIRNGKQYLKSVYPVKNNYPKFIDSTG